MPSITYTDRFVTLSVKGCFPEWTSTYYFEQLIRVVVESDDEMQEVTIYFHASVEENPLGPAYYDTLNDLYGQEISDMIWLKGKQKWNDTISTDAYHGVLRKLPLHVIRDCGV